MNNEKTRIKEIELDRKEIRLIEYLLFHAVFPQYHKETNEQSANSIIRKMNEAEWKEK